MTKESKAKPWERQENETVKQFEAFVCYRDMEERSQEKVAKVLGKSAQLMSRWSSANNWVERVAAWENEQDRILRLEQIKDIKKMRKRHADTGALMLSISTMGLKEMLDMSDPKHPKLKAEIELSPKEIAVLVDSGSKLERLGRGDVTEVIEERDGGEVTDPVQFYMPDNGRDNVDK